MEASAISNSSSIFFEYDLSNYSSSARRAFYPPNAKLSHRQFPFGRLSFPSPSWVATEWSCKAELGDGNAYLEELSCRYRGSNFSNCRKSRCKAFGRAQALPNDLPSTSTGVENSTSAKELSLEDERSSAPSSEGVDEEEVSVKELGQELLVGGIESEDFHVSSVEISESGANITQREVSVASLRIPSGTDQATEILTPLSSSSSSSQFVSLSSSSDSISSADESWLILSGDTLKVATTVPLTQRYAPRKLFERLSKLELPEIPSPQATLEQLRQSLMFWKSWGRKEEEEVKDEIAPLLGAAAFETRTGVSQLHQWTATELALQHAQLRRVARDVLYLMIACLWVGMVRVAEAVAAAFSSNPPVYSKLWEAANALDMFTIAWLAYSLRKPIVAILQVDPINLQQVVSLKAHIWQHMHNFYERQWKVVATLAMGRMLGLVATTLPSSGAITKNIKIGWDMLLALPIF